MAAIVKNHSLGKTIAGRQRRLLDLHNKHKSESSISLVDSIISEIYFSNNANFIRPTSARSDCSTVHLKCTDFRSKNAARNALNLSSCVFWFDCPYYSSQTNLPVVHKLNVNSSAHFFKNQKGTHIEVIAFELKLSICHQYMPICKWTF